MLLILHEKIEVRVEIDIDVSLGILPLEEELFAGFPDVSDIPESKEKSYTLISDAFKLAQNGQNPEEARALMKRARENFEKMKVLYCVGHFLAPAFNSFNEHDPIVDPERLLPRVIRGCGQPFQCAKAHR
jgi:hypothetical protein